LSNFIANKTLITTRREKLKLMKGSKFGSVSLVVIIVLGNVKFTLEDPDLVLTLDIYNV